MTYLTIIGWFLLGSAWGLSFGYFWGFRNCEKSIRKQAEQMGAAFVIIGQPFSDGHDDTAADKQAERPWLN